VCQTDIEKGKSMPREFAVIYSGKVVGRFYTAQDAEDAMRNLIPPPPPETLEVVKVRVERPRGGRPRSKAELGPDKKTRLAGLGVF
jgi:hypothetical protein